MSWLSVSAEDVAVVSCESLLDLKLSTSLSSVSLDPRTEELFCTTDTALAGRPAGVRGAVTGLFTAGLVTRPGGADVKVDIRRDGGTVGGGAML